MLRPGENILNFPTETPQIDLSPLSNLSPRKQEFIAVLDPPIERTPGGVYLRSIGDGWTDRHAQGCQAAEDKYRALEQDALERIAIYEKDKRSMKAYRLAYMASEVAQSAYWTWQAMIEPENPGAAMEHRPDSYTVAAVGKDLPIVPGDRVMVAPYAARRFENVNGIADVVLVGREDPWDDITIMIWDKVYDMWLPLSNWVLVELMAKTVAKFDGMQLVTTKKRFYNQGTIMMTGPDTTVKCDSVVALHKDRTVHRPDNTKWFATRNAPWSKTGRVLVREVDSDGERRVLGVFQGLAA